MSEEWVVDRVEGRVMEADDEDEDEEDKEDEDEMEEVEVAVKAGR